MQRTKRSSAVLSMGLWGASLACAVGLCGCGLFNPCGNGVLDKGESCEGTIEQACQTACNTKGKQVCNPKACQWRECISVEQEVCNGVDDDCDGQTDEGFECALGSTKPCVTETGQGGTVQCGPGCHFETSCMTTCDRLSAQAAALFDDLERQIAASSAGKTSKGTARRKFAKSTRRYRNCIPAGDGHWMLQPVSGTWESFREFDQLLLEVETRLTHVSNEGRSVLASETLRFGQFPCQGGTPPELLSVKTFDFDGDGVHEIILETSEGCGESKHSLHTMVNGRIGPYEPIAGIHIDKMIDYDKDGRMDIVSILNYWSAERCWGSDEYYNRVGLPSVLYHSLPDGTFSPNDSTARRYLRNQCPSMPTTLFVPPEADWELDAAKNISCARAWGMRASELEDWIARELRGLPDRGDVSCPTHDEEFLKRWAKIDPPVVLSD